MNRPTAPLLRATALWLLALSIVTACGAGDVSHATPTATVSAQPVPVATASASATAPEPTPNTNAVVGAWTEETVIAELAKDCGWDPDGCLGALHQSAQTSVDMFSDLKEGCETYIPLACARLPSQTCVPDECSQSDYACYPECDNGCASCSDGCKTSCESCKAPCKDDACRMKCAQQCGQCRQGCLQALDHCTTAHCTEVGEECFRQRDDDWMASTCPKVCDAVAACVEKCPEVADDWSGLQRLTGACAEKCMTKLGAGCPSRFAFICMGDMNTGINFWMYHRDRHPEAP